MGRGRKRPRKSPETSVRKNGEEGFLGNQNKGRRIVESSNWHQCQRNDRRIWGKGRKVVRCSMCKHKQYCIACIQKWYPQTSEDAITEACPVCLGNCNCKACLRLDLPVKNLTKRMNLHISKDEEIEHSKYLLHALLPFLKRLNDDQLRNGDGG
ncbi:hypothetical protein M0R45_035012 [Rubus argutus]|uniref:Zinc-finger domain-containing protein n=1 Tax=Rubus argutus TaxID=59490 RepID=A0AAW1VWB1_RUBAR